MRIMGEFCGVFRTKCLENCRPTEITPFFVGQFVGVSWQQDAVVVAQPVGDDTVDMPGDVGGAVVGNCVVKLGPAGQLVGSTQHVDQQPSRLLGRCRA